MGKRQKQLTPAQLTRLETYLNLDDIDMAYDYLANLGEKVLRNVDDRAIVWLRGAADVNRGIGGSSDFIRNYTSYQHEVRELSPLSSDQLTEISNEIGRSVINGVLETKGMPTLKRIAELDAFHAVENHFNGDVSAWSGNILFLMFGENASYRSNILESDNGTYDLLLCIDAFYNASGASTFMGGIKDSMRALLSNKSNFVVTALSVATELKKGSTYLNSYYETDDLSVIDVFAQAVTGQLRIGSNYNDNILMGATDNFGHGGRGDDVIRGLGGADLIDGGADNDTIYGGVGADRLYGNSGDDTFVFATNDAVAGEKIYGGSLEASEINTLLVQGQNDFRGIEIHDVNRVVINFSLATARFSQQQLLALEADGVKISGMGNLLIDASGTINLAHIEAYLHDWTGKILPIGSDVADSITGTSGTDHIYGHGGNDTLHGAAGDDVLYGGAGIDFLYGGAGRDVLDGNDAGDVLDGGTGGDTYRLYSSGVIMSMSINLAEDWPRIEYYYNGNFAEAMQKAVGITFTYLMSTAQSLVIDMMEVGAYFGDTTYFTFKAEGQSMYLTHNPNNRTYFDFGGSSVTAATTLHIDNVVTINGSAEGIQIEGFQTGIDKISIEGLRGILLQPDLDGKIAAGWYLVEDDYDRHWWNIGFTGGHSSSDEDPAVFANSTTIYARNSEWTDFVI
ncbi:hypothetical protein IHQ71_28350 [Rhizobium sp. TH2]|uniref:calcium-binding protein n=1 Tax=Rhizobium sp. TH2 TaxID=2775403 RepID=UPI0021FCEE1F|nr:calcium-binding protein [Rhizobium sp. TH2]UVC08977.1 hypothetical protein IHQ71_28350 [Rhizobium sp. TH2]